LITNLEKIRREAAIQTTYSLAVENVFEDANHSVGQAIRCNFGLQSRPH